ncbi:MAG: hypothetical protein JWM02_3612, partial [Frankiales bacterium]|nr:hypothetical protein [Frankiales bacterium]
MVLSGRFVLLVALGVVPLVLTSDARSLAIWLGVVVVLTIVDLLVAGSARAVSIQREVPTRVRLGDSVTASILVTNTGRRRIRGAVRDAWQPSAGASIRRASVSIPPGERRALATVLTPFRRGERQSAHVTVRSFGPLRLAARQATIYAPGAIRVLPPF